MTDIAIQQRKKMIELLEALCDHFEAKAERVRSPEPLEDPLEEEVVMVTYKFKTDKAAKFQRDDGRIVWIPLSKIPAWEGGDIKLSDVPSWCEWKTNSFGGN